MTSLGWLFAIAIIGARPLMPVVAPVAEELSGFSQRLLTQVVAGPGQHSMPGMESMPGMPDMSHATSSSTAQWCDDVVWSTFNHRVTGWFLVLWGLTAFIAGLQSARNGRIGAA
jgi:hypothetical protein